MSTITPVQTAAAPAAIGPYSQAVRAAGLIFCSGQVALDPATVQLIEGDVAAQTERVMNNLRAVLEAAGAGLATVVKTTIYLADLGDFAAVNRVYGGYFTTAPPARATIQVAGLPLGARVEIDAVAVVE